MKTPEEIKAGLKCHTGNRSCITECPYEYPKNTGKCISHLTGDALAYINQLEERIALMKIQMRGDCGTCRFRLSIGTKCHDCMEGGDDPYHPLWEYEGLPGEDTYHEKPV